MWDLKEISLSLSPPSPRPTERPGFMIAVKSDACHAMRHILASYVGFGCTKSFDMEAISILLVPSDPQKETKQPSLDDMNMQYAFP